MVICQICAGNNIVNTCPYPIEKVKKKKIENKIKFSLLNAERERNVPFHIKKLYEKISTTDLNFSSLSLFKSSRLSVFQPNGAHDLAITSK